MAAPLEPRRTLREFQAHLTQRLQSASSETLASKLGVACGGLRWLVDLTEVSEVVTDASVTPVPWVQPWFGGVANVRGTLYGCTDLAAFLGLPTDGAWGQTRLLLVHPRLGMNAALKVEETLGLHNPAQLQESARPHVLNGHALDFVRRSWLDAQAITWLELDVARLVTSARFLDVLATIR
ncbi:MAG: chemotaxis protein CheW [Thiobacillaceae bacterium]|nr:chemotaxis protein CheW [Thiobacillaceae bacterium]MCX7674020.1 chemotaxis protein CheW [Thiobacillaceae bacterium]MDW8324083.1 chemotaxis protein CheW [Burkholderiales bacterium]